MSVSTRGLRLVVYDRTDTGPLAIPRVERDADGAAHGTGGLTRWWRLGANLHRGVGRADASLGASSWDEALAWAVTEAEHRGAPIAELQAWGHGGRGYMGMGKTRLDVGALALEGGGLGARLDAFAAALAPGALLWLRCCSAFGHERGRAFGERLAERLGARVAGHTYIIGVWQSGTHSLAPGERAGWAADEGIEGGAVPRAMVSTASAPRTLTCLRPGLPPGW
jgi:hypothetical protein